MVEQLRKHSQYEVIGPHGLALYYHLTCDPKTSTLYGLIKTTKNWAAKMPLAKEDVMVAVDSLMDAGLMVRDDEAKELYLLGSACADRALPTTRQRAQLLLKKIEEYEATPLKALWLFELMMGVRASYKMDCIGVVNDFMIPYLNRTVPMATSESMPGHKKNRSQWDFSSWDECCTYGDVLLNKVFASLEKKSNKETLKLGAILREGRHAEYCSAAIETWDRLLYDLSEQRDKLKSREKKQVVGGVRELLLQMAGIYEEATGKKYAVNWVRETKMAKEALSVLTSDEIAGRFRTFVKDPWFSEKGLLDFQKFFNSINRWGVSKVSEQQDDGWFKKLVAKEKARHG